MITKQEATELAMAFLKKHNVGMVATATAGGQPFVSPVYFSVRPDFSVYFATSHHTEKFKNLLVNPQIAFCVGTGPEYSVVNIHGTAHMAEGEERLEAMRLIGSIVDAPMALWPIMAIKSLEQGGVALFKIVPTHVSYLNLTSESDLESIGNYFYQILP